MMTAGQALPVGSGRRRPIGRRPCRSGLFLPAARKRLIFVEEFDAYEGCANVDVGDVPAGTSPPSVRRPSSARNDLSCVHTHSVGIVELWIGLWPAWRRLAK